MKTIFVIEPYSNATIVNNITEMIGNHNAGKANLSLGVLNGYIHAYAAQFLSTFKDHTIYENIANRTLALMDAKENIVFVITEKYVHELELPNVPFPEVESNMKVIDDKFDLQNHSSLLINPS